MNKKQELQKLYKNLLEAAIDLGLAENKPEVFQEQESFAKALQEAQFEDPLHNSINLNMSLNQASLLKQILLDENPNRAIDAMYENLDRQFTGTLEFANWLQIFEPVELATNSAYPEGQLWLDVESASYIESLNHREITTTLLLLGTEDKFKIYHSKKDIDKRLKIYIERGEETPIKQENPRQEEQAS